MRRQVALYPFDSQGQAAKPAPSLRPEWDESHGCSFLLSYHHLPRPRDSMKLPKLLHLPKTWRRNRSKARSEVDPVQGQSEVDLGAPRRTESTPDLRVGISSVPAPSPLAPPDRESNGMGAI